MTFFLKAPKDRLRTAAAFRPCHLAAPRERPLKPRIVVYRERIDDFTKKAKKIFCTFLFPICF